MFSENVASGGPEELFQRIKKCVQLQQASCLIIPCKKELRLPNRS
jgi:hypothetical protein